MNVIGAWMTALFILILAFLLLSPKSRVDDVLHALSSFQVKSITALQGRYST